MDFNPKQKRTATSREAAVLKIEQDWGKDCQIAIEDICRTVKVLRHPSRVSVLDQVTSNP
jgi:hypothetical protein